MSGSSDDWTMLYSQKLSAVFKLLLPVFSQIVKVRLYLPSHHRTKLIVGMQPYLNHLDEICKTTSIFVKIEDDMFFMNMEDDLNFS